MSHLSRVMNPLSACHRSQPTAGKESRGNWHSKNQVRGVPALAATPCSCSGHRGVLSKPPGDCAVAAGRSMYICDGFGGFSSISWYCLWFWLPKLSGACGGGVFCRRGKARPCGHCKIDQWVLCACLQSISHLETGGCICCLL